MFTKPKKIKLIETSKSNQNSWWTNLKRKWLLLNPLLLTFIFTMINLWLFSQSFFLATIFFVVIFIFLLICYPKTRWLIFFLVIPVLSFLVQNLIFADQTTETQNLENELVKVIKKASTYVIVKWKHQKFYWSTFDKNFLVGQIIKIKGFVVGFNNQANSFNFDFVQYLKNENIYKALKIENFELVGSKNLKYLFFSWIDRQNFSELIRFFVFQQPSLQPVKNVLNELSLGYLLNFSGFNFFIFSFLIQKIFFKFHLSNYWKIPLHFGLVFYLYLISFPLVLSRVIFGVIIKNIFWMLKINPSQMNKTLVTLTSLFLIHPQFLYQQMALYLFVATCFFQKPVSFKNVNFWLINLFKSVLIFVPVQIFFQFRWNFSAPILSLLVSPLVASFYFLAVLFWWVPQINEFWNFFQGSLFETLKIFKSFSFSWNFGSEPFILILFYYFCLFWLMNYSKHRKIFLTFFIFFTCLLLSYSKLFLPNEVFYMLNVGNGSSFVYINKWKNLVIIYDCGSGPGFTSTNMADFLKVKGINHVDIMFISHFHQDHFNGMEAVKKISHVFSVITNETEKISWQIKGVKIESWKLEAVTNLNDTSLIIFLKTNSQNILLTGDLTKVGEGKLLENVSFLQTIQQNSVHLLQLGHHGSKTSSSEEFLTFINPENIFISAGFKNNHQFPDLEVLKLLEKLGFKFYSTAEKLNWKYDLIKKTISSFH